MRSTAQKELPTGAGTTAGSTKKHTHGLIVGQVAKGGKEIGQLVLNTTTSEARVDSRSLALQLGNKHRHVIALIDKYADRFKTHGHVSFKKADGERKQGGGKAERYALLNENQAYFLLSLSRNSEIVVVLKSKLITAFSDARRSADMRQTEYMPTYHAAHDRIKELASGSSSERFDHMNFNKLVNKVAGIEAGQRASAPVPKQALLIVGQMLATAAMRTAHNGKAAYQQAKIALQPLTNAMLALEVASCKT